MGSLLTRMVCGAWHRAAGSVVLPAYTTLALHRPPGSSSPLTNMLSAITSSLESFIRSLARCLPFPSPGLVRPTLPHPQLSPARALSFPGAWGLLMATVGGSRAEGGPLRNCSFVTLPLFSRHLRKNYSAPMRKVLPSWNSLSFWARKSNCRISRGKPQMKSCSDHVPEQGGSPILAP